MLSRALLMLLLLAGWSYVEAATHVNISIAQQSATNPADVSYVDGPAPAELRAGPAMMNEEERFERIQERSQQQQQQSQMGQQQQQQVGQQQQQQSPQLTPRQGLGMQTSSGGSKNGRMPRRRNQSRRLHQQLQPQLQAPHNGQFRQRNQQLRQNQEFERYIQSYHSHGPTVETVYESSNPAPQRYTQTSSGVTSSADDSVPQKLVAIGGSRSQQLRMFERQVAAPVSVSVSSSQGQSANVEVAPDSKPIYETPQAPVAAAVHSSSSGGSSSGSSSSSVSSSVSVPAGAPEAVPSYDSKSSYNPATSYNRPSYDPNLYQYDEGQDVDYQGQYPPELDDGQGYDSQGYDDYGDQASSYPGGSGYLPPAPPRSYAPPQRPMVTKTIQIAQPALKAKKYEVRHPAIQKEFYDIEERVRIKPAGTLVVELDHPVAKIPKGETLLPLGHPHPAVAAAYSNNGQSYNTQSSYNGNGNGNEYRPSYDSYDSPATSKDQQPTTVGSSVTTMPSYDQAPKDEYVEAKLQQQKPQQQQPAGDVVDSRQSTSSSVSAVDGNGNPIQINTKHLTPNMITRAEPEQEYSRSIPPNEVPNYERPPQRSYQQRTSYNRQPQPQSYNNNEDYFAGEFLPNVNAANVEAKPARLELEPVEPEQPRTQIIKHEHKIHLPPSQHNIYLGRSSQTPPKEQRITEVPARVAEIKPYLRNHVGPTVVYAKAAVKPAVQRGYYVQSSRLRNPLAEDLEYSAPYSQMRFSPENQSARLVEAAPVKELEAPKEKASQDTHIQIQIGNRNEGKQPMVVASTISPDCDRGQQQLQLQQQQRQPSARLQQRQQQSQRLVEAPATAEVSATKATPTPVQAQPQDVDVSLNGGAGHLKPNERVIAATAAPTDAAATSETFHKRRIVVNHPFQTVREVVEHEPITNYHQIQVNEHAHPALYHQAAYYQPPVQTHGNLVHFHSTSTHGNLYAPYG
ncbi:probable serine/threonine-protein kinase yakA [Drosophila obscura]|uniref:probable serine/threonine-protein kinase yakA n=1 Tax=Drosophila obscura TaxID=7282 RepID=UPI001BB2557B|nr:probable serine/threonine-protein kinase yakA [Drosophila obscura]